MELVDAADGRLVGKVKEVKQAASAVQGHKKTSYALNASGLDNRTVRLKITMDTNIAEGKSKTNTIDEAVLSRIPEAVRKARLNARQSDILLIKSYAEENMTLDKYTAEEQAMEELTLEVQDIPDRYALEQNYPNPFNPSTTILLELPEDGKVNLEVFDVNGRRVATLINGFRTAGRYHIDFNGGHLASGVYFYRVVTPNFSAVKRMLLVK
ncbi:MAG: T9SS type A sorting domain-containing protein [Calditrichaceae bacterium]|nr:T9SS type A sorting domain-containing protein [Calditrichaceae bacterium]RQV96598.1 MAG: T9SS C-terminal target domain-containing protein [Calditrichota bacterium]